MAVDYNEGLGSGLGEGEDENEALSTDNHGPWCGQALGICLGSSLKGQDKAVRLRLNLSRRVKV